MFVVEIVKVNAPLELTRDSKGIRLPCRDFILFQLEIWTEEFLYPIKPTIMEDQLITFDTAKLAKEKGFDWQTNMVYKQELLYTRDNIIKNSAFKNSKVYRATAPTQSLLQKWLREIHGIDVNPICNYHYKKGRQYHLGIVFINNENEVDTIIIKETDKSLDTINRHYNTFEEALEEGLQEGLKLK
jgi:hypothetical protein